MEKTFYGFNEIYNNIEKYNQKGYKKSGDTNPNLNDDYCLSEPIYKNNGILTMAFVDMQPLDSVYPPNAAFCNGTLFPNLDKPFYGGNKK